MTIIIISISTTNIIIPTFIISIIIIIIIIIINISIISLPLALLNSLFYVLLQVLLKLVNTDLMKYSFLMFVLMAQVFIFY